MRYCAIFVALCAIFTHLAAQDYYRLDDFDTSYDKLDDEPLPPNREKSLHPSSIYKQDRPPRVEKEVDYSRREIALNAQALQRLEEKQVSSRRTAHFFLGVNGGLALYAYDSKRQLSFDIAGRIGYWQDFSATALRIYLNFGGRFPLNNENPNAFAISANMDFLVKFSVLDVYAGIGYGGEYYYTQSHFSHGVNINVGFSKSFAAHSVDFGVVIPFYTMYINDKILKNNIIFLVGYNYKF